MANPDRPNGFTPVGSFSGAPWQALVRRGQMGNADGTDPWDDIFLGDPLAFDQSDNNLIIPHFTTVADCIGVCVGVGYVSASGNVANEAGPFNMDDLTKRWGDSALADSNTIFIFYVPSGDGIFEIQSATDLDLKVGDETDHNCTTGSGTHGSEVTSRSNVELKASGDDVSIVAIPEYPDNDPTLINTRYHVRFVDRAFASKDDANV